MASVGVACSLGIDDLGFTYLMHTMTWTRLILTKMAIWSKEGEP